MPTDKVIALFGLFQFCGGFRHAMRVLGGSLPIVALIVIAEQFFK